MPQWSKKWEHCKVNCGVEDYFLYTQYLVLLAFCSVISVELLFCDAFSSSQCGTLWTSLAPGQMIDRWIDG